jgi:SAM-dependent methyltransferase
LSVGTNELERRRWNDERWAAVWPKRERLTDAVTAFVLDLAALRPGERVLDVGCGGGRLSLAAAAAVGRNGGVAGADLSAPLRALAVRRATAAGVENAVFHVVDMQTGLVEGRPFDVVLSQFGVMFFDEPVTAFRNIRAHLAPGGRIVFACWQGNEKNPWFFGSAITAFLPPPPAPPPGKSLTGPFALADPAHTEAILRAAGFVDVRRTVHELSVEAPHDAVVDDVQFELMGIPPEREAAKGAVAAHMRQFALGPELSRFPLAFQLFDATG